MRVLHVGLETTATRAGGLNRYLEDLVAAERADGLDSVALVLADPAGATAAPHDGIVVAARSGGSMARASLCVDRAVRRLGRPDVADLHFAGTAVVARTVGALRGVPTVVHFQGPWADESAHGGAGRANAAAKRRIERAVYRRADRVVVLSSAFGELVTQRYGVAPWRVEVLAPGVDLDRFAPGDAAAARRALGVPTGRVALAVRRLVPRMGLEVLVEAWSRCEPGEADLLAIVGDGPDAARLAALADTLGVGASVRLCGRVDDGALRRWYVAADLTVVPSVALEGFGLVVLESLACGTPVLGTDAGGLGEALAALGQARAVPAGDVPALAAAMRAGLSAPKDESAVSASRRAAERHAWVRVAAAHRALYERVLAGREPLRVVVLDHTAALSGGELAIARAVGGLGGRAAVHAILAEDGPLRARLEASGATVEVLGLDAATRTLHRDALFAGSASVRGALATARYVVRLARRLRALRPDVVHTNSLKADLYGGAAARLARVPCVWHVRDRLEPPSLPSGAARLVHVAARVLPTVVVANSASTLATVGVRGGLVVPSPLDPAIEPHAARTTGPTSFTVLGRLAPWKGQHLAVEAFAAAFADSGETLRIVGAAMFGEDRYADSLAPLAAALGVADRVSLCGFVDDVASVLAATDVLVHSSVEAEPFGQVVVEAMGAGCAVLVADAGGPAEVVTDGVDGLTYAMGDAVALSAAMRRLAGDPALRASLGTAAVATATAYTPAALAPRLLAAWEQAVARGPARHRRERAGA